MAVDTVVRRHACRDRMVVLMNVDEVCHVCGIVVKALATGPILVYMVALINSTFLFLNLTKLGSLASVSELEVTIIGSRKDASIYGGEQVAEGFGHEENFP